LCIGFIRFRHCPKGGELISVKGVDVGSITHFCPYGQETPIDCCILGNFYIDDHGRVPLIGVSKRPMCIESHNNGLLAARRRKRNSILTVFASEDVLQLAVFVVSVYRDLNHINWRSIDD
jgi:hypothetical protein